MSKTNWKGFERDIAKALGVERYSKNHLGESVPDVVKQLDPDNFLVVECKNKKSIVVKKEMNSIEKYRESEKDIPIICFRKTNSSITSVFIRLKDYKRLYKWVKKRKKSLHLGSIVISLSWKDFLRMVD